METIFTENGHTSQTLGDPEKVRREQRRAAAAQRWKTRWGKLRRRVKFFILLVFLVAALILLWNRIFITVHSGEGLVVYYRFFGGTSNSRTGYEGLHIIMPWDKAYVYNIRTQPLVKSMKVLSKNGLEVSLDAQVRFRAIPEVLPNLHRRYGPDYVNAIVVPQLTEAVQRAIGQFMPEEIYSSETGASVNHIFQDAQRLIGGSYLQVENIALFNIRLPDTVQTAVQKKAEAQQNAQAYDYIVQQAQKEAERRAIDAKSLQQYATTVTGIPRSVLIWKGIEATTELAKSPNAKVIVMGSRDNLPLVLGNVPDVGQEK